MCGAIIGALSFSLPPEVRNNPPRLFRYLIAYNIGRIGSYVLAGLIIGNLGQSLFQALSPRHGHLIAQALAAVVLVGLGLHLVGLFKRWAMIERVGHLLWRHIEPVGKRFLPASTLLHAGLFGVVWGWLPCGLVYTALFMAASADGFFGGGMVMLGFGLGTLPVTLVAGLVSGRVLHWSNLSWIKEILGVILILLGLVTLGLIGHDPGHASWHNLLSLFGIDGH
ncbi:MAG: sulfite exporter TauE/SafE family protein [Magnetococcales bacterium]|nr:sulfite exporter TauE/SafE family protein [Magnetococcales bacterium]